MTVPNNTNYKTTDAISCFAWVKLPDWNVSTVMAFFSTFRSQGGFVMEYSNKRLYTTVRIGSSSKQISGGYNKLRVGGTQGTASGWHQIGFTFDGQYIKQYVDGVLDTSNGTGTVDLGSTGNLINYNTGSLSIGLHIGARYTTNSLLNGIHDDMAIWSNALTDAEILTIYNSGAVLDVSEDSGNYASSSSLTGWWRMGDDDTLPTIIDNSTNSNDATTINVVAGDVITDVPS